jgi:large repetitive protein
MQTGIDLKTILTTFIVSLTLFGCTKKSEHGSQVVVQLPKAADSMTAKRDHFDKIRKLEAMSELSWGLSRPTSLAETSCFAVVVELPASERDSGSPLSGGPAKTCTRSSGTDTIYVSQFAGLAAAGSQIEINMAPGSARKFHLFAFSADSASECALTDAGSLIRKSALSGPLHIGSATADIVSGNNNIEIVASYSSGLAYENCEWTEPAPLVGGAFQINAGATHTNSTALNLTPSLPFVASQAYYTSDSTCRTGGVWEPYSVTRSGFSISAGDGVKDVYARFRDSSGAVSSCMSAAIILDQTAPTVSINTPPPANAMTATNYAISGSCSEEGRIVAISVNTFNTSATCSSGLFSVGNLDLSSLGDGNLSMSAVLTDIAGNSSTNNRALLKDTVLPTLSFISPAIGGYINANSESAFNVMGTCSDAGANVDIFLDGMFLSSATCAAGTFSSAVNLTAFGDGVRTFMAQTMDPAGNNNSESRTVTKDIVPPVATILNPTSAIHLDATYTTLIGGADVVMYRWKNGSTSSDCFNPTGYAGPFAIATPINQNTATPQTHAICVLGIDAAGNEQLVTAPTSQAFTKGPVLVSFVQRWSTAPDSVGLRLLDVSISPPLTNAETLYLEVQGSATAGNHYTGYINGLGSMSLPAMTSSTQVEVSVIGGSISAEEKRLSVSLTGASHPGIRVGSIGTHQVWIENTSATFFNLTKISIGVHSGCGLNASGKLYCWGNDAMGAVGDGAGASNQAIPVHIDPASSYVDVAVGSGYACGVRTSGDLTCWGNNANGQIGDGTTTTRFAPVVVDSGTSFIKIATYASTTCGITSANQLKCWGYRMYGQVGDGGAATGTQLLPVVVNAGTPYMDVAMGSDHGCAVRTTGQVDCWGRNDNGQIGNGTMVDAISPSQVSALANIQRVYSGQKYSCAIDSTSKAFCWGDGLNGKLGNLSATGSNVPVAAHPSYSFTALSLGSNTTCGVDLADSTAKCWGYSYYGLLGNGSGGGGSYTPVTTMLPSPVSGLAGNAVSMCGIGNGRGYCWGYANNAHLGTDVESRRLWASVPIERNFASMALGRGGCGIRAADSALSCWGPNDLENVSSVGQIGDGSTARRLAPVFVDRPLAYTKISVGTQHTCGLTQTGDIRCWGYNASGQLGNGNIANQFLPVQVASGYSHISVGTGFSCGIASGVVNCWGRNDYGQLGIGGMAGQNTPTPTTVVNALQVSVGATHACAVSIGGALYCWGRNDHGQLGQGDLLNRDLPTPVSGSWLEVSAGANVTCAINTSSSLYCWGRNADAEIGQGATTPLYYAVPTYLSGSYTKVMVGSSTKSNAQGTHVCALSSSGQLSCWGSNRLGQNEYVGASTFVTSPTPVDAGVYSDFAVGEVQTCGKRTSGTWFCRGFTQESHLPLGVTPEIPNILPRLNY